VKKFLLYIFFFLICFNIEGNSHESNPFKQDVGDIFNIGKMLSHDKKFTLFLKTRDKAVLAKGILLTIPKTCIYLIIKQKKPNH